MPVPHLEIRIVQRSKGSSAVAGAASLFVEALQRESYIEYLLDVLLYGTPEEKKALVAEQRKEVMKLEQRIAEHRGGSPKQFGAEPER